MQNTELRRTQVRLRAARDRYRELYDLAPLGWLRLDRGGAIRDPNVAACALLDLSRAELVGRTLSTFVTPADRAGFAQHLRTVFATGVRQTCEVRLLSRDGVEAFVRLETRAQPARRGAAECQVVLADVTQQRKLELALEVSRAESRAVVQSAMDAILTLDEDQRVVVFNAAAEQMFRCRAIEVLGGGLEPFLHLSLDDLIGAAGRVPRVTQRRLGVQAKRADGTEFPGEASISVVDVAGRRLVTVIVRDLTERVRAETEVRKRQDDLARSQLALTRLARRLMTAQETERTRIASDLHDDLGQRLAAIHVDLDRLGQQIAATPVAAEMHDLRARLAAVSDDLTGLARELHPAVLEHLGLTVALRDLCRDFERRDRVATEFRADDVPEALPKEVALCLYRVVQEALRNVAKHTVGARATVALRQTRRGIGLCIRDSGQGFRIAATSRAGLGLGLVSMEERLHSVEGRFSVRSRPGRGTHVHAWAPLRISG